MTGKCKDCPLLGEDTSCLSRDRRWEYFCEWAASGDEAKRRHIVYRSRVGAETEKPAPDPGPPAPQPAAITPLPAPPTEPPVARPDTREKTREETDVRRAEEARLQRAVVFVEQCRYRGGPAECKCNGKRKCGKGRGSRGEVTLNNCIDCVLAGMNR